MKTLNKYLFSACLAAGTLFACTDNPVETPTQQKIDVSAPDIVLELGSTTQTFKVTSTAAWKATADASWITFDPKAGDAGETSVTVSAEIAEATYIGKITITGNEARKVVNVTRKAKDAVPTPTQLEVNHTAITADADGKLTDTISITTNKSWIITSNEGWVAATPARDVAGSAIKITLTVEANETIEERTATLSITAGGDTVRTVTITQAAASFTTLEISPAAISVTAAGKLNDGSNPAITLTTNQNWTVTSDSAWLTATPASGAAGSAIEVTLNVAANTIVAGRTAILTVTAGDSVKIVTVTQAAAVPDDGKPTGFVYFEDDFSWVTGGDDDIATHIVGTARNMYTWAPPGGVAGDCLTLFNAHGYTDDVNPTNQVIYFMNGYLKFSKTRYHGGLSFYATSLGTTPTDVTFSFDKVTYKSNPAGNPTAGNYDPNNKAGITTFALVVAIDGLGSVGVNDGTTKTTEACDMFKTNGTPWAWENVEIVLYGITKDTKITIKTNQVDTPDMLCRYYLDNLKVVKR